MKATKPITTTTTTTEPTTYGVGDAVIIRPQGTYGLRASGNTTYGIVEYVVTDTEPHPTRGPLYHIRITDPDARGWFGLGVARNYADELTPAAAPAYDGEQLGTLVFDIRADHLAQTGGLWVYPASYDDLRLCMRRVEHLSESFGVQFFALHIRTDYLRTHGRTPGISMVGYYPATTAENTAKLRCHVQRALDRARAMAPRDGTESEA